MKLENVFEITKINSDGSFIDFSLIDNLRNSLKRHWVVTFDHEKNDWYGILQRAEDDEAPFEHDVFLPRRFVKMLVPLVEPHI